MIEKTTNDFIGNIEIIEVNDGIGEIGISITFEKQNKHYGQESIKALMEYGFNNLNIKGFDLNVHTDNARAIKCYENIGFIKDKVGLTEEKGQFYIHMIYQK